MTKTSKAIVLAIALATGAASVAAAQESDPLRTVIAPVTRTAFPDMTTGEALYKGVCSGCHMADAKGAIGAGAYPGLVRNERLGTPEYPIMVVLRGQKAMPPFANLMSDEQVAAVVGYIRAGFSNGYKAKVSAAEVSALRAAR